MALVRATLATALSTVQQLIGDLRKAVRETGPAAALDQVLAALDALDAYCGRRVLEVDVVVTGPLSEGEARAIAGAVGVGFPAEKLRAGADEPVTVDCPAPALSLRAYVRPLRYRTASRAGTARPPVLVLVAVRPPALTPDDRGAIERLLEDRPQVLLVGPPDADHLKELEARVRALAWSCLKVDPAAPPGQSHQARLSAPPFDTFPDVFRAHAAATALESLLSVLAMSVEQQQREIKVNRSVVQQKLARFTQKTPVSPAAEITAEIKARTQRLAGEFERGAAERLQELLGQPMGSLARELDGMVQGLSDLEEQPKTATIAVRVPPAFEEQVNRTIRERVARHCAQDLVAINDLFRMIGQDVERTLAQASGPPIAANFRYLTDERVRRMLDAYGSFQSQYRGEIPAKGFGDYFASVRKYSMFLVMGASMFGMSAMLRQYREIVFPVTLMLVAWGSYNVFTGAQRQRVETKEKELEAARASTRSEIKRILGELQKQWGTFLTQYLNEQTTGGLAELDAAIKDYQTRRGVAADPEKERLQRQMQGLDTGEKKLLGSVKGRDALVASVAQVKADLKALAAAPGTSAARPGLPAGGPGAARPPGGGLAAARAAAPTVPSKAPGPSLADAKAAAMAEAKAKLDAMKAARAASPVAPGPAAPSAPAAAPPNDTPGAVEAKLSAADAFKAKMAALKTVKTPGSAPEPGAPTPEAGAAKPSALDAYKARMAALKESKAPAAPTSAPAASPAESVALPVPAPAPPAESSAASTPPPAITGVPALAPVASTPNPPPAAAAPAADVDLDATIALEMPRPEAKASE